MEDGEIVLVVTFFELIMGWLQLKQQNQQESLFQTHPKTMTTALNTLVLCWFLYGFKLRFPRIYAAYLTAIPLGIEFFGLLSMASVLSFLFPDSLRPLVYFILLLIPSINMLRRIFEKLEAMFSETEFWRRNIDPVVLKLTRKARLMRPILPR
ncbi:unnamed protein product [Withania somnifera]